MLCVLNVREAGSERKCLVQWEDDSIEWKILAKLSSFKELVAAFDVYLKEHQSWNVLYTKFVSAGIRSIQYTVDSLKKRALN